MQGFYEKEEVIHIFWVADPPSPPQLLGHQRSSVRAGERVKLTLTMSNKSKRSPRMG